MAVLLSKGALALFAFTAFASATGPLASSASDIESERKLRLRGGQEVKDYIKVDSFRRLGTLLDGDDDDGGGCPGNLNRLDVGSEIPLLLKVFDLCLPRAPLMFQGSFLGRNNLMYCIPEGHYEINVDVSLYSFQTFREQEQFITMTYEVDGEEEDITITQDETHDTLGIYTVGSARLCVSFV